MTVMVLVAKLTLTPLNDSADLCQTCQCLLPLPLRTATVSPHKCSRNGRKRNRYEENYPQFHKVYSKMLLHSGYMTLHGIYLPTLMM